MCHYTRDNCTCEHFDETRISTSDRCHNIPCPSVEPTQTSTRNQGNRYVGWRERDSMHYAEYLPEGGRQAKPRDAGAAHRLDENARTAYSNYVSDQKPRGRRSGYKEVDTRPPYSKYVPAGSYQPRYEKANGRHKLEANGKLLSVEYVNFDPYFEQAGQSGEKTYSTNAVLAYRRRQDAERVEAEDYARQLQYQPAADSRREEAESEQDCDEQDLYEQERRQRLDKELGDSEQQRVQLLDRIDRWDSGNLKEQQQEARWA